MRRSNIRCKNFFAALFMLPILIPSMSHGMGLILLFGVNGVITNALGITGNIYGFWGIVLGAFMYSFPVAYLMLEAVLRFEDGAAYDAATVLGIPKLRQISAITWPYLRKPILVASFAIFSMVITDYGVPLMIGGRYITLPVMLYEDVIGLLDFSRGSVIGVVLLIPTLISFFTDFLSKDRANASYITTPVRIDKNLARDALAGVFCFLMSIFVLLPLVAFGIVGFVQRYPRDMSFTFAHVERALRMQMGQYLVNSLIISLTVAALGTCIVTLAAYITARTRARGRGVIHMLSVTSLAIPGNVLGLSYVLAFSGTAIYGTLAILVMVNFAHFFSQPYLMIYNTFSKQNANLEDTGAVLGVSRWRILLDVLLPQNKVTLAEMFSYLFVNSMMTISAVAFVANVSTRPVAVMITTFDAATLLSCSSVVSLVILAVNASVRAGLSLYKARLIQNRA
jgi:iron(III) transport system permease protein